MQNTSIRDLKKNVRARVVRIMKGGDFGRRIRALGIFPGADVEVLNRPFFTDSIMIRVDGCTLVMRKSDTDGVIVSCPE